MVSLEQLWVRPEGFDIGTASPLQLSLTRAADGLPIGDDLRDEEVERYFGCERSKIGLVAPVIVAVVAGVRGGKSLLTACAAIKCCLTADLSGLKPHEIARFAIMSARADVADALFKLLVGAVMSSKTLRKLVIGKSVSAVDAGAGKAKPTADTLTLRRPDGRVVEIVVVAASRGAVTVRGRWLVGFAIDEVAQVGSEATGAAVNAEELLRAAETRLVPGGQGWLISSPYGPSGLLYELFKANFGKPGEILVCWAPTRALNPTFPQEKIDRIRARDPDTAAREYDAQWLDADEAYFDSASIERAIRGGPLERTPVRGAKYVAAWDTGTRGNAWTLVIARNTERAGLDPKIEVALAREWIGSRTAPLKPEEVIREIAQILRYYGVSSVLSDSWSIDALDALARAAGFQVQEWRGATRSDYAHKQYRKLAVLLSSDRIELPPHPVLKNDLKLVRKKATSNGIKIVLPLTADKRHCDFAPALVLASFFAEMNPATTNERTVGGSAVRVHTWEDDWRDEMRRFDSASLGF